MDGSDRWSDKVDEISYYFSLDESQMEPDREDNHPGPPEDVPLDIVIEERAPENHGLLMMALCERLWKEGHSIIGTENLDKNDSNKMEFLVQGILRLDDLGWSTTGKWVQHAPG